MQFEQITIVGVGLIGGSVGLAAKARGLARRVVGVDRSAEVLQQAGLLGAIDLGTTDLADGVREANLVVVCTPVDAIANVILAAAPHCRDGTLFTDAGSTKAGIAAAVLGKLPAGVEFMPAHPLAGAEKNGVENARADLFLGRPTILTPSIVGEHMRLDSNRAASEVSGFWQALGSEVVWMLPDHHDEVLAATSHLPHAVASAVAAITPLGWLKMSAGGFRDVTRVAAGNPRLWAAIFEANRDQILSRLAAFTDRLSEFRMLLEAGDRAGIERWLTEGKQVRDALGT